MAAKFIFPELTEQDLGPAPEEDGSDFLPLYAVSSRAGHGEDWRPMLGSAPPRAVGGKSSGPSGSFTPPPPAAGLPPAPGLVPQSPPPPPPPRMEAPRVDPRELERIRAQAREEGYKEGYARGEIEGRNTWLKRTERVETLLLALGETREQLFRHIREDLVKIMTLVPRKILRQALQLNPQMIGAMVGSILEELPRQERVVVKVCPDDLRMLEEALPDIRRRLGGYTQVELEPSSQVSPGGAQLVTEGGRVDATIDRQLETFELRAREWILGATGTAATEGSAPAAAYTPSRSV